MLTAIRKDKLGLEVGMEGCLISSSHHSCQQSIEEECLATNSTYHNEYTFSSLALHCPDDFVMNCSLSYCILFLHILCMCLHKLSYSSLTTTEQLPVTPATASFSSSVADEELLLEV